MKTKQVKDAWLQVTLPNGRVYRGWAEVLQAGEIGAECAGWRLRLGVFGGVFHYDQSSHGGVVHSYAPIASGFIDLACERNRKRAMIARLQRRGRPVGRLVKSMRADNDGLGAIEDHWARRKLAGAKGGNHA